MNASATTNTGFMRPEVHGHRGCRGLWPENTLPAFRHAVALGVDVLELDVVISSDGQVVVSHEPWFSAAICRLPNGQPIDPTQERQHNLYQMPYAHIKQYDCGLTRHPNFPEQQLLPAYKPLLREVIRSVEMQVAQLDRAPVRYSIELKTEPAGDAVFHPHPDEFVALVLAVIGEELTEPRTTILSFDHRILQQAQAAAPHIPLCLLIEDQVPLAEHLRALGFVPQVLGPAHWLLTPELLATVKNLDMRLVPWTVNDIITMRRLIEASVTGITTDYPDRLLQLLASW
ncbi:glycerophosphodiester phosphodiesterase family protein [Hymenobacter lucidus]|uniref:Glycerophosphodiester phosphodiesterase n=1 Tax=Hymenobacter lucidus TaxID=2880930 RepID=A0ABS8AX50_9BACT|nr:glycerophosphodiester phosphodiesterase family protein [Hymenobacter lucidus]MCB2410394.1 glycerophosphodiester phosphodiesterase [Hymenobacter lucidus]